MLRSDIFSIPVALPWLTEDSRIPQEVGKGGREQGVREGGRKRERMNVNEYEPLEV